MLENCARCGQDATPWEFRKDLKGHVCYDCHCDLRESDESKEKFNGKKADDCEQTE